MESSLAKIDRWRYHEEYILIQEFLFWIVKPEKYKSFDEFYDIASYILIEKTIKNIRKKMKQIIKLFIKHYIIKDMEDLELPNYPEHLEKLLIMGYIKLDINNKWYLIDNNKFSLNIDEV